MRALHVAAGNLYGGVESILTTIASRADAGFATVFEGRLAEELRAAGAPVDVIGPASLRRPWTVLAARRRLAALVERVRPAVTVFHGCWAYALLGRAPAALWLHDVPTGRSWVERLARRSTPELVIANSRFTAAAAPTLFPRARVEVLHAPVPLEAATNREETRAALGASPDQVVILLASRLERWKGHELLLEALELLRDEPRWVAWIAGGAQRPREQRYLEALRARAASLGGRVRFLGESARVRELLAAADIHCQPNTAPEPFGVAFVEALAASRPVVTTAIGGALEVIDGSCGVLVPAEAAALAAALRRLVNDPAERARLGAAGPLRARTLCDPSRQIARLEALLERQPASAAP